MRSVVLPIVMLCLAGNAFGDLPETILKIKPSVVAVGTVLDTRRPPSKFRGTGFVVGNGNLIITNAHVVPDELEMVEKATQLRDSFKEEAVMSLIKLQDPSLKGLLRRVMGKIFDRGEIKDWCREYETRNAASGKSRAPFTV